MDDDEQTRVLHTALVGTFGYEAETARDGVDALEKLDETFDLILLDAQMPNMDGFEVAAKVRETAGHGDLPIVMVSGLPDKEDLLRAFTFGINDFITKPVHRDELKLRLHWLIDLKFTRDKLAAYQASLEEKVHIRTVELREALAAVTAAQERTHEAHLDTIRRLTLAAEYKDRGTAEHLTRTGLYSQAVGRSLGLPEEQSELLLHAAPMHDVGKLGIPDHVLLKAGPLTPEERTIIEEHPTMGARVLAGSVSPELQMGERIALTHHERWDGTGYPNNLAGEDIPLEGRICAVVDFFDALTQHRPYRKAVSVDDTLEMIREGNGSHFAPHVVKAFMDTVDEVKRIHTELPDTESYDFMN